MTPAMVAAQEQRLRRIAELERLPRTERTIEDTGLLGWLAVLVRRDAARYGGEYRRTYVRDVR